MVKVVVCGAAGGIGQPLSLLLKQSDLITHLALYDIVNAPGVAADLSHINTPSKVTGHGKDSLAEALKDAHTVVIPAGVPRKPGMTRDDLFKVNASIVRDLAEGCAQYCPKAFILVISNPVNSTVPIVCEVLKKANVFDPRRVFGVTTLDVVRSSTFVHQIKPAFVPHANRITVVGGHSGATIVPILEAIGKRVIIHQVAITDTLAGIALYYGIQVPILKKSNKLWTNDSIHTRKYLYIPVDECSVVKQAGMTIDEGSNTVILPQRAGTGLSTSSEHSRAGSTENYGSSSLPVVVSPTMTHEALAARFKEMDLISLERKMSLGQEQELRTNPIHHRHRTTDLRQQAQRSHSASSSNAGSRRASVDVEPVDSGGVGVGGRLSKRTTILSMIGDEDGLGMEGIEEQGSRHYEEPEEDEDAFIVYGRHQHMYLGDDDATDVTTTDPYQRGSEVQPPEPILRRQELITVPAGVLSFFPSPQHSKRLETPQSISRLQNRTDSYRLFLLKGLYRQHEHEQQQHHGRTRQLCGWT
ncbi:malate DEHYDROGENASE, NAD-dependent [Haplosporangium bisporale]|nr:malate DEHYDROGENASE, NAD-dependent [Haplosporangium bisporale]